MKNIINFLQNKLNLLCDEYNLSRIKVVFNSSLLKGNKENARMFSFSLGCYSREDLLEQYSVDFLSYLIKNPNQIELLLEVLV